MKKSEKHLGVFWGHKSIYLVESSQENPQKIFSVPFFQGDQEPMGADILGVAGSSFAVLIQESLRTNKISPCTVNLSLSTKDIIFRSFVIPWMSSSEIRAVVEFEGSKYVPFALEELSYSYHASTFIDDGTKRIRIIFVAIKKDTLEEYIKVLEQASLEVDLTEPASLSLMRALTLKNLIPQDQTVAILEKSEVAGRITIVDQGVPQFVREVLLKSSSSDLGEENSDDLAFNFLKEIRISLDYFNRQDKHLEVKKIILITENPPESLSKYLESDLAIPVVAFSAQSILGDENFSEIDFLNAYGVGLNDDVNSQVAFSLSQKKIKPLSLADVSIKNIANFKVSIISVIIFILVIAGVFIFSNKVLAEPKSKIEGLNQELGSFKDFSTESLKKQNQEISLKLTGFKNVQMRNEVASFLKIIPGLLPEGTWIKDFNLVFPKTSEKRLALNFSGYVYSENINEQFRVVNKLLESLKANKGFSEYFENIDLKKMNSERLHNHEVTFFKVQCQ